MKCPNCGSEFSDDLRTEFCPSCGGRFDEEPLYFAEEPDSEHDYRALEGEDIPLFTAEPSEPGWEEQYYCPWEDRDRLGVVGAWWQTTKTMLLKPSDFFRSLPPTGRLGDAFLFAVIWLLIGGVIQGLYMMLFQGIGFLPLLLGEELGGAFGTGAETPWEALGLGIFCAPIVDCIFMLITAAIFHLFLSLLKGATQPFEATLRVVCYATINNLFAVIPICGGLISLVYWIVIAIIGASEVHRCGGGKAAAAVLLPMALCLFCLCTPFFVLFAFGFLAPFTGLE